MRSSTYQGPVPVLRLKGPNNSPRTPRQFLCKAAENLPRHAAKPKPRLSLRTLQTCLDLSLTPIVVLDKKGSAILCNNSFRTFVAEDMSLGAVSRSNQSDGDLPHADPMECGDCCEEASAWLDSAAVRRDQLRISGRPVWIGKDEATAYSIVGVDAANGASFEQEFLHDLMNATASVQVLIDLTEETESNQSRSEYLSLLQISMQQARHRMEHEACLLKYSTSPASIRELFDMLVRYQNQIPRSEHPRIEVAKDVMKAQSFLITDTVGIRILDRMLAAAIDATQPGEPITLSCQHTGAEAELRVQCPGEIPLNTQKKIRKAAGMYAKHAAPRVSINFDANGSTTLAVRCLAVLEAAIPNKRSKADSVSDQKCG